MCGDIHASSGSIIHCALVVGAIVPVKLVFVSTFTIVLVLESRAFAGVCHRYTIHMYEQYMYQDIPRGSDVQDYFYIVGVRGAGALDISG